MGRKLQKAIDLKKAIDGVGPARWQAEWGKQTDAYLKGQWSA